MKTLINFYSSLEKFEKYYIIHFLWPNFLCFVKNIYSFYFLELQNKLFDLKHICRWYISTVCNLSMPIRAIEATMYSVIHTTIVGTSINIQWKDYTAWCGQLFSRRISSNMIYYLHIPAYKTFNCMQIANDSEDILQKSNCTSTRSVIYDLLCNQ